MVSLMETPTTSVTSTATMIAPKRVVMIDDMSRSITSLTDPEAPAQARSSQTARTKHRRARQTASYSAGQPVHGKVPVTCSTCRMSYLPSAISPATSLSDRVCDNCQQPLA